MRAATLELRRLSKGVGRLPARPACSSACRQAATEDRAARGSSAGVGMLEGTRGAVLMPQGEGLEPFSLWAAGVGGELDAALCHTHTHTQDVCALLPPRVFPRDLVAIQHEL